MQAEYEIHWNKANSHADTVKIHYKGTSHTKNRDYSPSNHMGGYLGPFSTFKEAENAAKTLATELNRGYRRCKKCFK